MADPYQSANPWGNYYGMQQGYFPPQPMGDPNALYRLPQGVGFQQTLGSPVGLPQHFAPGLPPQHFAPGQPEGSQQKKKKSPKPKSPKDNKKAVKKKPAAKKVPKKKPKAAKKKVVDKAELARKKQAQKERAQKVKMKATTKGGKKKKERDPDAPKRARTAFNFFLDNFRDEYKKENPETKGVVQVTKAGSERWKQMTPETKQPFEDQAAAAREIYTKAKADYEAKGGAARFKLQKGPPRPPTAYFMFLSAFRQEYKLRNPEVKGIKDMSREAGEKWRGMDQDAKRPFEEKAKRAKDEYNKLKAMTPEERLQATEHITNGKIYEQFM